MESAAGEAVSGKRNHVQPRYLIAALLFVSFATGATAATAPVSRFEAAARRFVINFSANRLELAANDFNEQMRTIVPLSTLATLKKQFDDELGHFMSVTDARESTDGAFPVVELTARFEKASASFQVVFDAAGRIGAIHFNRAPSSNPELEKIARDVLNAFTGRRFELLAQYFDPKMNAQLPPPALESLYTDITAVYGKFKSITSVRYTAERKLRVIIFSADYEKMPARIEVVFDTNGRVAGWRFEPNAG